jgi:hypothetical protein
MISVNLHQNSKDGIKAFTVQNHGASHVCAAVSLLVINTINSIEKFTDTVFKTGYRENGGYIHFELAEEAGHDVTLLLKTMMLGLRSVCEKYPDEIEIIERK